MVWGRTAAWEEWLDESAETWGAHGSEEAAEQCHAKRRELVQRLGKHKSHASALRGGKDKTSEAEHSRHSSEGGASPGHRAISPTHVDPRPCTLSQPKPRTSSAPTQH